ncbi:MAG: D-alanyl-D-alanine carboxypeptidase family protein [Candidatus Limivivens sp.]|nr:D-alanyl-D-alanine carboxypeptidase family protein [Candidatus Limivivens sp.]
MKKLTSLVLAVWMALIPCMLAGAEGENLELEAPNAILMEASTGAVLYEKAADEKKSPASVTKIMTLLLIFEALEEGRIQLTDEVVTSAHAKSMGGSQVFLEEGEKQSVETLIKCIVVASGNDAAVAMAEHLAGTDTEFVARMNEKAKNLGMENTHFVDCCGLTDDDQHYTSARDIGIMTRELITRFPEIYEYSTIWMENITHVTRQGTSEFGLTNTNKLLRSFEGCLGLKTGSTSKAKYCLSATARRNGIELIAVVLAAPDSKTRFANAASLLNYGFGKCRMYTDENAQAPSDVPVSRGVRDQVSCRFEGPFRYLDTESRDLSSVEKEIRMEERVRAPIVEGDVLGEAIYRLNGKELGRVNILAAENVEEADFLHYLKKAWDRCRQMCYDRSQKINSEEAGEI